MKSILQNLIFSLATFALMMDAALEAKASQSGANANRLFVSAMRDVRKAKRIKAPAKQLELYKSARDKLENLIVNHPDDQIAVKLLSGRVGNKDWFQFIERRIHGLERKLERSDADESFQIAHQDCLERLTPDCLVPMYEAKMHDIDIPYAQNSLPRAMPQLEALRDLANGDDKAFIKILQRGGGMTRRLLWSFIKQRREELLINLMIRARRSQLYPKAQITNRMRALLALKKVFRNPKPDRKGLNYQQQGLHCNRHASDWRDYSRGYGKDGHDIRQRMNQNRRKLSEALCENQPAQRALFDHLKLMFSREAEQETTNVSSYSQLPALVWKTQHRLRHFGKDDLVLKMLFLTPQARLPKERPAKENYKFSRADLYRGIREGSFRYLISQVPIQEMRITPAEPDELIEQE